MEVSDSITGEYQTTIHFDFYGGLSQYNVRYFANDTLGNEALTDEFIYRVFEFPGTTSDGDAAVHDTPDIIYQVGTTGNVLRWTLLYGLPGDSATYSVRKDGYPIEISPLSTSEIITNIDGLRIGSYLYEFSASDFFGGGYDNATVTVVEDLNTITQANSTTSTTLTSTTTTDDIPPNLEFLPFLGGLTASILILILVLRRIKQK
jgi:hypothetical protein